MSAGHGPVYALVGLAALLLAIAASSGWSGAARLARRASDTSAVAGTAAAFVTAYGTFDFRDPDGYSARLAELTTGELRDAIASAAVNANAVALQRMTTVLVDSVLVTALSENAAIAAVRSRHERTRRDPATGRAIQEHVMQHVTCRLVRRRERWLVSELLLRGEEAAVARGGR